MGVNTKTEKLLFGLCTDQPIKTGLKGDLILMRDLKIWYRRNCGEIVEAQEASCPSWM